jgi:hypothetical protein
MTLMALMESKALVPAGIVYDGNGRFMTYTMCIT